MRLTKEQIVQASKIVRANVAIMSDVELVAGIKEKLGINVSRAQVTSLRTKMGLKKTRGRKSRLVVTADITSTPEPALVAPVTVAVPEVPATPAETDDQPF